MKLTGVKIEGHVGTWYSLDSKTFTINDEEVEVYLFEHEYYGGDTWHVFATADGKLLMQNVRNGWGDWYESFVNEQEHKTHSLVWDGVIVL